MHNENFLQLVQRQAAYRLWLSQSLAVNTKDIFF